MRFNFSAKACSAHHIGAHPQDLGVKAFVLGEIQLESQGLLGSDTGEGRGEEKQQYRLPPLILGEPHRLSDGTMHDEIRGLVPDVYRQLMLAAARLMVSNTTATAIRGPTFLGMAVSPSICGPSPQ